VLTRSQAFSAERQFSAFPGLFDDKRRELLRLQVGRLLVKHGVEVAQTAPRTLCLDARDSALDAGHASSAANFSFQQLDNISFTFYAILSASAAKITRHLLLLLEL